MARKRDRIVFRFAAHAICQAIPVKVVKVSRQI
jgi:hypothetical protein